MSPINWGRYPSNQVLTSHYINDSFLYLYLMPMKEIINNFLYLFFIQIVLTNYRIKTYLRLTCGAKMFTRH